MGLNKSKEIKRFQDNYTWPSLKEKLDEKFIVIILDIRYNIIATLVEELEKVPIEADSNQTLIIGTRLGNLVWLTLWEHLMSLHANQKRCKASHKLGVLKEALLIKQKKRNFAQEREKAIKDRVSKLSRAYFIWEL